LRWLPSPHLPQSADTEGLIQIPCLKRVHILRSHEGGGDESEIGAGGMATVYLATDLKHDRRVAVKVLRPELAGVVGADRFLNEIKVTAGRPAYPSLPASNALAVTGSETPYRSRV